MDWKEEFVICTESEPRLYVEALYGVVYVSWVFEKEHALKFTSSVGDWIKLLGKDCPYDLTYEQI